MSQLFTDADAEAFMATHLSDNEDAYAAAVEAKLAEYDAWNGPLIDIVLNQECPVTSCLLKQTKDGGNALEWSAEHSENAFRDILALMAFGIQNAVPHVARAFASVRKALFTEALVAAIQANEATVAHAIMMEHNLTCSAVAAAPTVDVENMNRADLSAMTILDIMDAFARRA